MTVFYVSYVTFEGILAGVIRAEVSGFRLEKAPWVDLCSYLAYVSDRNTK